TSDIIRVCPVQLPGREERYGETLHTNVVDAIDDLMPTLFDLIDGDARVALFGHSLGAVLAYEAAQRLSRVDGLTVTRLFVSGSPGPWTRRTNRATGLPDEDFLGRVKEIAGYAHPALEHPDLRGMLLPILRADVEMHEGYQPPPGERINIPIT